MCGKCALCAPITSALQWVGTAVQCPSWSWYMRGLKSAKLQGPITTNGMETQRQYTRPLTRISFQGWVGGYTVLAITDKNTDPDQKLSHLVYRLWISKYWLGSGSVCSCKNTDKITRFDGNWLINNYYVEASELQSWFSTKQCATRNSENRKPPEIVHFNDDNDDSAVRESSTFMFSAVRDRAELK